jgi:RimJ/RimL family protein N-acetyltransferase
MTISPFAQELSEERVRDLRKQTLDHVSTSARRARPPTRARGLTLRVRPVRPRDAPLLADIFARLSPASRFARFLSPKQKLTAAELGYFSDIDHHNHEALIAITRVHGEPVGVARFIRDPENPTSAEIAVEVVDAWQNRGVGSLLATRIAARARREKISQLTALMLASNHRSARLLAKVGGVTDVTRDGSTLSYRVTLPVPTHRAWSTLLVALAPVVRGAWYDARRSHTGRHDAPRPAHRGATYARWSSS